MKKTLLFCLIAAFAVNANAQTFSDDFESYTVGQALAATSPVWETWSSANGGADDTNVSATLAHSGSNSLYFTSTGANGGPQDCVLPFPAEMNTGQFTLEMWMYINSAGTGAYFNLQQEDVIGTTWAADIYFLDGGIAQFTSGGALMLAASFPEDAWFKLTLQNDLSTNTWEVLIDDVSQGSYANASTQIASMDIYPVNGNQFYVDDVSYEYVPYTVTAMNGAVTNINNMSSGLSGQVVYPQVVVRNLGSTAINSFDLDLSYNGNTLTQNITGVNIASLAFYTVNYTQNFTLVPGANNVVATISNVNGNATDDAADDDVKTLVVNPIVPATGKKVVAEEATGTWCPWCVRGAVFMDMLSERYGDLYVGVAVHNADPMTVDAYDAGIGPLIGGYPSGVVDRGPEFDPSQFEIPFLERIQIAPNAFIENGANWDATTRTLNVSATTTFQQTVSGNYKIALVLTEDDVTGTTSGFNQANAYAGGGNGDMGGFENLPSPVPAAQMTYNHVARAISPAFNGLPNAFMGMMNAGNSTTHNFTFVLPLDWDETTMHIVAMVIAPDGTVDNAQSASINDAVANGFVAGTAVTAVQETFAPDANFNVYPNPTNDVCIVTANFSTNEKVQMDVYSADGKLVATKNYGQLAGAYNLPINTEAWDAGLYTIKITYGNNVVTKTLMKQ